MGLCTEDAKKRRPFKTIIIPRGIINPNENNIIEIPVTMDATSSLIVKAPSDANSCFSVEPFKGDLANIPPARYPTLDTSSPVIDPNVFPRVVNPAPVPPSTFLDTTDRKPCQPEYVPNQEVRTKMKSDFSCQTQESCGTSHSVGVQKQSTLCSSCSQQTQEAHSPLCPICAKASCKYFSKTGINRPYNPTFSQFTSPTYPIQTDHYGRAYPPYYSGTYDTSFIPPTRSEILSQSRERFENELLNKILDEKVDKILKPVLFSLAKFSTEDDNERFLGSSSCIPKPSYSSIQPKASVYDDYRSKRETYDPSPSRRSPFPDSDHEPRYEPRRMRDSESFGFNVSGRSTSTKLDYEPRPESKRIRDSDSFGLNTARRSTSPKYSYADSNPGSSRRRYVTSDRDFEDLGTTIKRPITTDPDSTFFDTNCPPNASCQRRPNVSFEDRYKRAYETQIGDKRIDLSSSGYSLTPRSSF